MKSLFQRFSVDNQFEESINFIDLSIRFRSDQKELIGLFTGPLGYLLPPGTSHPRQILTCVVASTTEVEGWPDVIKKEAKTITSVNDDSIGEATIYATDCGMTLFVDGVGSIYHSGDGEFLCLVTPTKRPLKEGESLHILPLATTLISESLIFSEKLLIHAGAAGINNECQIWTGPCGSGKTTQILTMVASGMNFFGEDQIIVGRGDNGVWTVWPFWRQIRATSETAALFPSKQNLSVRIPNNRDKYSFDNIEEVLQVSKPDAAQLTAIVKIIPGQHGIMRKLDFAEAFQHLAEGFMHSLLPHSTSKVMDIFLEIIEEIPVVIVSWDRLSDFGREQNYILNVNHAG
jgi:hypothetical protein